MRFCRKLPVDALRQPSLQIFDLAAILTDRFLKNSDRPIVKASQTVGSPDLTDRANELLVTSPS